MLTLIFSFLFLLIFFFSLTVLPKFSLYPTLHMYIDVLQRGCIFPVSHIFFLFLVLVCSHLLVAELNLFVWFLLSPLTLNVCSRLNAVVPFSLTLFISTVYKSSFWSDLFSPPRPCHLPPSCPVNSLCPFTQVLLSFFVSLYP